MINGLYFVLRQKSKGVCVVSHLKIPKKQDYKFVSYTHFVMISEKKDNHEFSFLKIYIIKKVRREHLKKKHKKKKSFGVAQYIQNFHQVGEKKATASILPNIFKIN